MIDILVADTCSFVNLAVVHRVDLLQDLYGGRITCVEAVHKEVVGLTATMPELTSVFASSWFDDPVTFTDGPDIAAIERLRCTVLGGRVRRPRQHLGEAQSIHAVATIPSLRGAVLLTDDRAAADYARRRRLRVLDSVDVLSEAYEQDLVGCPEAYDVLVAMQAERRGVRVPATHYRVCPPAG
jgi:predicted nucleic acid-binding protein